MSKPKSLHRRGVSLFSGIKNQTDSPLKFISSLGKKRSSRPLIQHPYSYTDGPERVESETETETTANNDQIFQKLNELQQPGSFSSPDLSHSSFAGSAELDTVELESSDTTPSSPYTLASSPEDSTTLEKHVPPSPVLSACSSVPDLPLTCPKLTYVASESNISLGTFDDSLISIGYVENVRKVQVSPTTAQSVYYKNMPSQEGQIGVHA